MHSRETGTGLPLMRQLLVFVVYDLVVRVDCSVVMRSAAARVEAAHVVRVETRAAEAETLAGG